MRQRESAAAALQRAAGQAPSRPLYLPGERARSDRAKVRLLARARGGAAGSGERAVRISVWSVLPEPAVPEPAVQTRKWLTRDMLCPIGSQSIGY
jgi:hypothetical protein